MALNDKFKLTAKMTYRGQQLVNTYWYEQRAGSQAQAALTLAQAFENDVQTVIRTVQHTSLLWTQIDVINLDNFSDYASLTGSEITVPDGTRTGGESNTFLAWGFRLNRAVRGVHHGAKRIGGVADDDVVNGTAAAGLVATLASVATALGATLGNPAVAEFIPRIGRTIKTGPVENPVYEYQFFPITNVSYIRVTTQNSRK